MEERKYATHSHEAKRVRRGLRTKARHFLRRQAISALARLRSVANPALRCLYSHYVYDDQVNLFAETIAELTRIGTFVTTPQLVNLLRAGVPVDRNYFHLSFDDGFQNVMSNALPVLKQHNVPAIIFVATSFIGSGWEDARRYSIDITNNGGVIETTTWAGLRQAVADGFEVGSHTATHARLSQLQSVDPIQAEVLGSKTKLEEMLQTECDFISWPFGTDSDINAAAINEISAAGFRGCFSAVRGSVVPGQTDVLRIPRHQIEFSWPKSHISYFARGGGE